MKIFLDTNIWFSAFYGSKNCQTILESASQKKFSIITSKLVVRELTRNISQKIPHALDVVSRYMLMLSPEMIEDNLEIEHQYHNLADPKYLPILLSAYCGKAKYFVTGNIKDFAVEKIKNKLHLEIITPSKFVEILQS